MQSLGGGWRNCSLAALVLLLAVAPGSGDDGVADQPPPAAADATRKPVAERNITRTGEPWLRLNTAGHTGTVQALAFLPDSRRLCSGGLDKVVQVWDLSVLRNAQFRNLRRDFLRERTIRWQVARGPRGSIYALAASPTDNLLAIGGYGAMGSTGEILLVDALEGMLAGVLEGHRQTVCSLAFSADGGALVSVDVAGETRLWRRPDWTSRVVYRNDEATYGQQRARQIADQPHIRPTVVVGNARFIVPVVVSYEGAELRWKLQEIDINNPRQARTLDTLHRGLVTALSATPDGKLMTSADLAGNVYVWNLAGGGPSVRLNARLIGRSLALSPDGRQLAVGTAVDAASKKSQLQLWDLPARRIVATRELVDHVHACAISGDGRRLAYLGGPRNEVFVEALPLADAPAAALRGWQRKIFKVAFSKQDADYRVALGAAYGERAFNDYGDLSETFDPATGMLNQDQQLDPADWNVAQARHGAWSLRLADQGFRVELLEGNVPRGVIQLDREQQGHVRSYCWLAGRDQRPRAIAIGTDTQNGVYVYGVAAEGSCPLLRQFRGHQDYVTSISVSSDQRYLVSGAADGMLQFWSLDGFPTGASPRGRWGADFVVEEDRLVARNINEAGPLYRRGVRDGDVIDKIGWALADGQPRESAQPQPMAQQLQSLPPSAQVMFEYSRGARLPKRFQLVSAWQPVATLFASEEREWAFWTPEGYYDASTNGHTLFGWQVNHGLHRLPEFFRADEFRRTLERPEVLRQLLAAGTLDEAFRRLQAAAPAEGDQALVQQIAAAPRIEILSPRAGELLPHRAAKVRARVSLPLNGEIVHGRVFANGVGAPERTTVEEREDEEAEVREVTYEWDVGLPRGARQMIQVFVSTAAQTATFERVMVDLPDEAPAPPTDRPKLHVLAVGVGKYTDPKIESLEYALSDARAVVQSLVRGSGNLYEATTPVVLADDEVTRARWTETFTAFARRLRAEARPDDLLVMFFAGHGEVDDRTRTYHFLCHDAKISTLLDGSATISWNDLELLADVPCRKLALLDTCHSGAIQGPRQESRLAIRQFQENVVFTVAAAAGDQGSLEAEEWGHGAFTKSVVDGMNGLADASGDGIITLDELIAYVSRTVPELARSKGYDQHPAAAPEDLLELVVLPVTQAPKSARRMLIPAARQAR